MAKRKAESGKRKAADVLPRGAREDSLSCLRSPSSAFTLLELLVSMALLIIIVGMVAQITNQTSKVWQSSAARIQTFQEARAGFESMTRKLSQATLNVYFEYYDASKTPRALTSAANLPAFIPSTYDRYSELHFISGQAATLLANSPTAITTQTQAVFFQAPLGYSVTYQELDNALNADGYFLRFDDASAFVPPHVLASPAYKPRWRWRLMEMTEPTEQLAVYSGAGSNWFVADAAVNCRVIAENVIALVVLPKLSNSDDTSGTALAPKYNYNSRIPLGAGSDPTWTNFPPDAFTATKADSTTVSATRHHQLPPILRVVMIAIDEASAVRLQGSAKTPPAAINLAGTGLFTDAASLDADVQAVEDICNAKSGNLTGNTMKLNYRVFSSEIIVRDAKWSKK